MDATPEKRGNPVAAGGDLLDLYAAGRGEVAREALGVLGSGPMSRRVLKDIFWSNACLDRAGGPHLLFPAPGRFRIEAAGPDGQPGGGGLFRAGRWLLLPVTTNWVLPLRAYDSLDDYTQSLSKKMRKNLRYFDHVQERGEMRIVPVRLPDDLDTFLDIFRHQWPESAWLGRMRRPLEQVYGLLDASGRQRSLMVLDTDGRPAAAALGYYTERAYNLHLLTRRPSPLDKYSPGFYLTYHLIREIYREGRAEAFIMGPGAYDYKSRFLAKPLPVYRGERLCLLNLFGIIRLFRRARRNRTVARP